MTGKARGNLEELPAFAQKLRALMIEQRIGVNTLAERTGIDPRLLSKYRMGRVTPRDYFGDPTANARLIAAVLNVTPEELFAEPEEMAA